MAFRRSPRLKAQALVAGESPISFLPSESLIAIFTFLPIRSRCRAARVCKRWRTLMQEKTLWRHVRLTETVRRRSLSRLLLFVRTYLGEHLETLVLHHVSDAILLHLARRCPKLSSLSLRGRDLRTTDLAHLPSGLLELRLVSYQFAPNWYCSLTQGLLYRIEQLDVFCTRITNNMLGHLATLRTLRSLQLVAAGPAAGNDASEGTQTESGFSYLVQQLTELRVLRFQQCAQLCDSAFFQVGASLGKLEELTLHCCSNVTDVGLKHLKRLSSLRILDLGGGSPVSPEALMEVLDSLPGLAELWIFDTDHVRQRHIEQVRVRHPRLVVHVKDRWDSLDF